MQTIEVERLKTKNPRDAIITNISQDFNLTPILAKAYYEQIEGYFKEHSGIELTAGQISYEGLSKLEPAGKPLKNCIKKSVRLTVCSPKDLDLIKDNKLSAARQNKILRVTQEAKQQGTYLTCEDLANIFTTSISTVKRDIAALRMQGIVLPLRGIMKDIGRVTSHKTAIVRLYLEGYTFTDIERKTHHSEKAIMRYLKDFTQVALLTERKLLMQEIRQTLDCSQKLVSEYQELYHQAQQNTFQNIKLEEILNRFQNKKGGLKS